MHHLSVASMTSSKKKKEKGVTSNSHEQLDLCQKKYHKAPITTRQSGTYRCVSTYTYH